MLQNATKWVFVMECIGESCDAVVRGIPFFIPDKVLLWRNFVLFLITHSIPTLRRDPYRTLVSFLLRIGTINVV